MKQLRDSGFFSEDAIKLRHVPIQLLSHFSITPIQENTLKNQQQQQPPTAHSASFYKKISSISNISKGWPRNQIKKYKTKANSKRKIQKTTGKYQKKWKDKYSQDQKESPTKEPSKAGKQQSKNRLNCNNKTSSIRPSSYFYKAKWTPPT